MTGQISKPLRMLAKNNADYDVTKPSLSEDEEDIIAHEANPEAIRTPRMSLKGICSFRKSRGDLEEVGTAHTQSMAGVCAPEQEPE